MHTLEFSFACHLVESGKLSEELVFGTGGKLLQTLKRLMSNLPGLRHLVLNDLLLERHEAVYLLDDVVQNCCQKLRSLRLVNCSRGPCPILHTGVFLNLRELYISPQQLSDDVVQLISFTSLRNMHIVQNAYTDDAKPVSPAAWKECRHNSPHLRVHLRIEGNVEESVVWQERAPVKSLTFDSAFIKVG